MPEHTPGTWIKVPQTNGDILIAREFLTGNQMQPKGLRIVGFIMTRGNSLVEDEANANLVASAPELLQALQQIDSNAAESVEWIRRVARSAIAKAEPV